MCESDHNYDHGSLYVEADGTWRVIAPTDAGPQAQSTGGGIVVHVSGDEGRTWRRDQVWRIDSGRNQTYVRRPLGAREGFYAYWADGDALRRSSLYFGTKEGEVFRLPGRMRGEREKPVAVRR